MSPNKNQKSLPCVEAELKRYPVFYSGMKSTSIVLVGGLVLGGALGLATLPGCYEQPYHRTTYIDEVGVTDDYVYYPGYEVYYSYSRHDYLYRDGNVWVRGPAPRGVSVTVLRASPSVRMDFHDSPMRHHETVVHSYPRNWRPGGPAAHEEKRHDER